MKTLKAIVSVFLTFGVFAATVPQRTLEDYYFSRPIHTNLTGTVMGKPPAYNVMRYEDIAWLREAACERAALLAKSWRRLSTSRVLMPNYGPFPLSYSNRFYRYTTAKEWVSGQMVTNIVVGWNYVTNWGAGIDTRTGYNSGKDIASGLSFGSGFSGYLSTNEADWVQGTKLLAGSGSTWNLPWHTNITTTVATNYPSSYWGDNGLVLNRTTAVEVITMQMTNGTTSVHTNTWNVTLPQVQTTVTTNVAYGSSQDLLFTGGQAVPYDVPKPAPLSFIPLASTIEKYYDWLGGMRRIAFSASFTNSIQGMGYSWRYGELTDSWEGTYSTMYANSYRGYRPNGGKKELVFITSFSWEVLHTGNVYRISKAVLYAVVNVYLSNYPDYRTGYYGKRIGELTKVGSPQSGVYFKASVDLKDLIEEAATAAGITPPDFDGSWDNKEFRSSYQFYIVVDFAPWASLPDW